MSCNHNHDEHKKHHHECGCHEHHHHDEHEECECHKHNHEECGCHHHEHCCCSHEHHEGCGCGHDHKNNYFVLILVRAVISVILMIVSTTLKDVAKDIVLIVSYLIISYDILYSAFKNVIKGRAFDENFLMSIASLTALIVPIFTTSAHIDQYDGILVIILYQIGEFIQHKAVDKSKESISEMLELDVEEVDVIRNEETIKLNVKDIVEGDIIVVMPGDVLVVDGEVVGGSSSLNTASLTGESLPRDVYVGDKVLSGSINNDGLLHIKATTRFNNSTTAKVKEIVEKANKNKASIDRLFTKFARVYTPVVIVISLIIMFLLPLILGFEEHFLSYLYKGLAIMVISCPCALVISIPLSYFMGIGKAAKNQILVKGASYLEVLSNIDTIIFDKTGTLTKGEFSVVKIESKDLKLMKELLYSVEKNFTHAIAKSITKSLKDQVEEIEITDLINVPGFGVKGYYEGKEVLIGNQKLLSQHNIFFEKVDSFSTVIYVSYDGKYLGYLIIEDELKNDAVKTIIELLYNHKLYIISGDKYECVSKVSKQLGITEYYAELLPEEKHEILEEITKTKQVIYVGDGINDAACLVSATVGIAMKSIGSDVAINASDIVLMNDDLDSVLKAIKISRKTKNVVIQNIVFSLTIKAIVMALAIFIGVPMYVAIIADVGVAMLAILNALRIMYTKI